MTTTVRRLVTRGSQVDFATSFTDATGSAFTPANATLYVAYYANSALTTNSIAMTEQSDGSWSATWSSAGADLGVVDWTILAHGTSESASNGSIVVVGNRATP